MFRAELTADEVVALHYGRGGREVIVVDGTSIGWDELERESCAPAEALASWRAAGERWEEQKQRRQRRSDCSRCGGRLEAREP